MFQILSITVNGSVFVMSQLFLLCLTCLVILHCFFLQIWFQKFIIKHCVTFTCYIHEVLLNYIFKYVSYNKFDTILVFAQQRQQNQIAQLFLYCLLYLLQDLMFCGRALNENVFFILLAKYNISYQGISVTFYQFQPRENKNLMCLFTCSFERVPPCSIASRQLKAEVRIAAAVWPACHTRLGKISSRRNTSRY